MKFPWQRRADEAEAHRIEAQKRLAAARADWPKVHGASAALRHEYDLNGWTGRIKMIFESYEKRHK